MVKEANLAFALNIHLFSLIRQATHVTIPASKNAPAVRVPRVDKSGKPLRYYEMKELERDEKARVKLLTDKPVRPNTWMERIERFAILSLAVAVSAGLSKYGWPWLQAEVIPHVRDYAEAHQWPERISSRVDSWTSLALREGLSATETASSVITAASAVAEAGAKDLADLVGQIELQVLSTASQVIPTASGTASASATGIADSASSVYASVTDVVQESASGVFDDLVGQAAETASAVVDEITQESSVVIQPIQSLVSDIVEPSSVATTAEEDLAPEEEPTAAVSIAGTEVEHITPSSTQESITVATMEAVVTDSMEVEVEHDKSPSAAIAESPAGEAAAARAEEVPTAAEEILPTDSASHSPHGGMGEL